MTTRCRHTRFVMQFRSLAGPSLPTKRHEIPNPRRSTRRRIDLHNTKPAFWIRKAGNLSEWLALLSWRHPAPYERYGWNRPAGPGITRILIDPSLEHILARDSSIVKVAAFGSREISCTSPTTRPLHSLSRIGVFAIFTDMAERPTTVGTAAFTVVGRCAHRALALSDGLHTARMAQCVGRNVRSAQPPWENALSIVDLLKAPVSVEQPRATSPSA